MNMERNCSLQIKSRGDALSILLNGEEISGRAVSVTLRADASGAVADIRFALDGADIELESVKIRSCRGRSEGMNDYAAALIAEAKRWNQEAEALGNTLQRTCNVMEENLRRSCEPLTAENALATMRFLSFVMITTRNIIAEITDLRLEQGPEEGEE